MTDILASGAVRKMKTRLSDQVEYQGVFGTTEVPMNALLGKRLRLDFLGAINCVHCDRKTSKSFNQGYCYPCFRRLAQCDTCIMSPEKCHFAAGTCRLCGAGVWRRACCMLVRRVGAPGASLSAPESAAIPPEVPNRHCTPQLRQDVRSM